MKISKKEKIGSFDINAPASDENSLFGLPFNLDESGIVILPVPWDVTVSYNAGAARGPAAVLKASAQVDLYDSDLKDAWKNGIFILPENKKWKSRARDLRKKAFVVIDHAGKQSKKNKQIRKFTNEINLAGEQLKNFVKQETLGLIEKGKLVAVLGGDHSTPLGFMEALSEKHPGYGILQIDAHCDLREAYEGFTYSHASIMYNALQIKEVTKLVQVGIRDFCQEEINRVSESAGRVKIFFDHEMKRSMFEGFSWKSICDSIIRELPEKVYISFDIDGLDPSLCPNTGTPVAGGLQYEQAVYLIWKLANAGKKIIGFDINEIAPGENEWDANVGARLLYKLSNLMWLSNNQARDNMKSGKEFCTDKEEGD